MSNIRMHLIGDHGIGKMSLIVTYTTNFFPTDDRPYLPIRDFYYKNIVIEKKEIRLIIQDMACVNYGYKKLRNLEYIGVDVFAICFSFDSPNSLQNAINLWIPEIKELRPDTPFILVGLKSELRDIAQNRPPWRLDNSNMELIPNSTCENLKNTVGAEYYIECSSKNKINIDDVFINACKSVLKLGNATENTTENISENISENKTENNCCYIS